jgi:hypothetical protein
LGLVVIHDEWGRDLYNSTINVLSWQV